MALTAVTGLPGEALAHDAALALGFACLISGALVAYVSAGWGGLARSLPMLLLVGAAMGLVQWLVATSGLWTLGSTSGALAGAVVGVAYVLSPLGRGKVQARSRRGQRVAQLKLGAGGVCDFAAAGFLGQSHRAAGGADGQP